jgi:hypothetical protein
MSWLLVIEPDSLQAAALREALGAHISEDVVVAEALGDALASIDRRIPDVILVPTLIPAAMEDYLVNYLGTIPGAGHVQILGLPRLERADDAVRRRPRSLFPWRRRHESRALRAPGCDPGLFTQDVVAYLACARTLKREIERHDTHMALSGRPDRRREPRFTSHDLPWISFVRFGSERAAVINLSALGALLRTHTRPEHRFLRRSDPNVPEQPRVTLELPPDREVHAVGRVIRCVPLQTGTRTEYEVALAFDESIGLYLPSTPALTPAADESA